MNNADAVSVNDGPYLVGLLGWYTASYTNATYQSTTYTPQILGSAGGASGGNFYSYGISGAADRALGTLPSDSTTGTGAGSIRIGARFVNNTGETITGLHAFPMTASNGARLPLPPLRTTIYVVAYAIFAPGGGSLDSRSAVLSEHPRGDVQHPA